MAWRSANISVCAPFNSNSSCFLLDLYGASVADEIQKDAEKPHSKTFAPSSMRCKRLNWFRLRGTQPNKVSSPDTTLAFTADIGTACHELIQRRLSSALGDRWIDVQTYFDTVLKPSFSYSCQPSGYETLVSINYPPIKFAVDGLIKIDNDYCLLEIKSSEFSSFEGLSDIKDEHYEQVKTYCSLLKLRRAFVFYIDRQYGSVKCFEKTFSSLDWQATDDTISEVLRAVEQNIAPQGLPVGDKHCSPSRCPYYKTCREWGRT